MELNQTKWCERIERVMHNHQLGLAELHNTDAYIGENGVSYFTRDGGVTFTPTAGLVLEGAYRDSVLATDPQFTLACLALFAYGYDLWLLLRLASNLRRGDVIAQRMRDPFLTQVQDIVDRFKMEYTITGSSQ